jgi:hypothetical protein
MPVTAAPIASDVRQDAPRVLYARLLGSAWHQLAEPVRVAHTSLSTIHAVGRLRVGHGRSHVARLVAWLLRLPRAADAAETRLVVTPDGAGERWLRTFANRRLETVQYEAGDGELAERIGILELRFRLHVSDGSLLFHQVAAAVRWASIRVRLPALCAPYVEAREDPAGPHHVCIHVRVEAPALGTVLTYDGTMDIEDARA